MGENSFLPQKNSKYDKNFLNFEEIFSYIMILQKLLEIAIARTVSPPSQY